MQAIGFETSLPITDAQSLLAFEAPMPSIAAHEVLVKIEAIAVNPVDIKIRNVGAPPAGEKRILGWDAAGGRCRCSPGGGSRWAGWPRSA